MKKNCLVSSRRRYWAVRGRRNWCRWVAGVESSVGVDRPEVRGPTAPAPRPNARREAAQADDGVGDKDTHTPLLHPPFTLVHRSTHRERRERNTRQDVAEYRLPHRTQSTAGEDSAIDARTFDRTITAAVIREGHAESDSPNARRGGEQSGEVKLSEEATSTPRRTPGRHP